MIQWSTGVGGLGNQSNQEPYMDMVKDKDGRPPGELGVSKSMECDTFFPSVL